jgi:glycosyltransferase involved in cell wall biosynthesis
VIYYGCEGSDVPCSEVVVVCKNPTGAPYQQDSKQWKDFVANSISESRKRRSKGDIALLSMGCLQSAIEKEFQNSCEFAVGYTGYSARHCVFPSYAWMHYTRRQPSSRDAVIPHYLDPQDWSFSAKPAPEPYLLFLGRLGAGKGEELLGELSARTGIKIVACGAGPRDKLSDIVDYRGLVGHAERLELMRGATALICPTQYVEPFGLVAIEAMACGTPVISTDFGAFVETVTPDAGFRCVSMKHFERAVSNIGSISREACRARFERNYTIQAVWPKYEDYFSSIS